MQYVKKVFPAFMTITLFRRKPVRQHIVLASVVVVKGGSVFLCVGIGIRFLAKPDTQRGTTVAKGALLDWKGILTSLFFGLTIGFGAGFVGSGGGMMMLVVFTAFLGMERRSAVGTSTFIMTFTALIAVCYGAVHPQRRRHGDGPGHHRRGAGGFVRDLTEGLQ